VTEGSAITMNDAAPADRSDGDGPDRPDSTPELERLRAENAELRAELAAEQPARHVAAVRRRRRIAAVLLVVLGSALLPVSVLTVWVRNQVFDTDRYLATVEPLASDPTVQSAVADRISRRVSEEVDFEKLAQDALPEEAAFLAVPIAAGANSLISTASKKLVESEQFQRLWVEANRAGHDGLVKAIKGEKGDVVSTEDGRVVLKLGGLAQKVLEEIDQQFGIDLADKIPAEKLGVEFVLVNERQLSDLQAGARMLDRLSWLSVILAFGCLAGSVAADPDRRRGLRNVGLGTALSMLLLLLAIGVGREMYLANLPEGVQRPDAAAVLFDTLTRFILQATRVLFAVGAVLLVGAWLAGPTATARRLRDYWDRLLGRGSAAAGGAVELGPVPAWAARNLNALRGAILVAAVLVLLAWNQPTGKVVLLIALLTLVPLAIVQLLAGVAATNVAAAGEAAVDADSSGAQRSETHPDEAGTTPA
jgi:hypothetical protein